MLKLYSCEQYSFLQIVNLKNIYKSIRTALQIEYQMCSPTSNKMKFLSGFNSKFSQCSIFRVSVPLRVSVCACALINMRVTRAAHSERRRRRRRLWRQRNRRTVMPKSITLSKRTPTSVAVVAVAAGSTASASLTAFKCRQQTN